MRLRGKRVGELTLEDLQALIEARVGESRELDYKLELPGGRDDDKRELLADVSSFANSAGGVLLYGVTTERDESGRDTGIPAELTGVQLGNADREQARLLDIIRDGLSPRLAPDVAIQLIPLPHDGRMILVLGVPRSLAAPHAVWFAKQGKFYRRTSAGKHQADVQEIRRMFLEAQEWEREAEAFCSRRIDEVLGGALGIDLHPEARTFVHVVPLGPRERHVDLVANESKLLQRGTVITSGGVEYRFNFEGFLVRSAASEPVTSAYTQWFRRGAVESCTDRFHYEVGGTTISVFGLSDFSGWLPKHLQSTLAFLSKTLGVDPPFSVHVTLLDMARRIPDKALSSRPRGGRMFSRDRIVLAPILIVDPDVDPSEACAGPLQVLWQSAGYPNAETSS